MKTASCIVLVAMGLLIVRAGEVRAWSGLTHIAITRGVMDKLPTFISGDKELSDIVLASCVLPDLALAQEDGYKIWHDPDFAEAWLKVAETHTGRDKERLQAIACGWVAHLTADDVVHAGSGYSGSMSLFPYTTEQRASHLTVEFCVELLDHAKDPSLDNPPRYRIPESWFLDAFGAYCKAKLDRGETVSFTYTAEVYQADATRLWAVGEGERALYRTIEKRRDRVSQLDTFFAGRFSAPGGIDASTEAVKAGFEKLGTRLTAPDASTEQGVISRIRAWLSLDTLKAGSMRAVEEAVRALGGHALGSRSALEASVSRIREADTRLVAMFAASLVQDDLGVEDCLSYVQGINPDGSPVLAHPAETLKNAQRHLPIARRRVSLIEERMQDRSLKDKVIALAFGDDDKKRLEWAKQEVARWSLLASLTPPVSATESTTGTARAAAPVSLLGVAGDGGLVP